VEDCIRNPLIRELVPLYVSTPAHAEIGQRFLPSQLWRQTSAKPSP
jgi:hypothetical protein